MQTYRSQADLRSVILHLGIAAALLTFAPSALHAFQQHGSSPAPTPRPAPVARPAQTVRPQTQQPPRSQQQIRPQQQIGQQQQGRPQQQQIGGQRPPQQPPRQTQPLPGYHPAPAGGAASPSGGIYGHLTPRPAFRTPPAPDVVRAVPGGGAAAYRPNGSLRSYAGNGMSFHKGPGTSRTTTVELADHSSIHADHSGNGWAQKPFYSHNVEYGRRTVVSHGSTYDHFYRTYPYHGVRLSYYAPVRYYPAAFYAWGSRPWGSRVSFDWGWQTSPWFGYYGGAFSTYAFYDSPSMWMTDYMLGNSMESAYQRNYGTGGNPDTPPAITPMSPDVKQGINEEVRRQMSDLERQRGTGGSNGGGASSGVAPAPAGSISDVLADNREHTFVNGAQVLPLDDNNTECTLTEGDTVRYSPPPPAASVQVVDVTVMWSNDSISGECPAGGHVRVGVQDLQEMQNFMLASIDEASGKMHTEMASGALPKAPGPAAGPPTTQGFTQDAPAPDTHAKNEVDAVNQKADRTDQGNPKS